MMTIEFDTDPPEDRLDTPLTDLCYIASEVLYHTLGGKKAGWKPCQMNYEGMSHWYLQHESGTIIDLTAGQFKVAPIYTQKGKGFLTKKPSKRAQAILARMRDEKIQSR